MRRSVPQPALPGSPVLMPRTAPRDVREAVERVPFRADVEGLRAVAVLLVVLFHAGVPGVTGGYVGVDVFFVLSGFLITGLLLRELRRSGTVSLLDFYARRVRRLLPVSALVLVSTALASLVLLPPLDRGDVLGDVSAAALYVANWHFALADAAYTSPSGRSPLLHLWSLSVEEQFYLVWPLLLLGVASVGRRSWWPGVQRRTGLLVVLLGAASLALSATLSQGLGPWAYYGLHTRAWELLAGAGLALAVPALPPLRRSASRAAGLCGLVLVVGAALVLDETSTFPGTAAAYPVVGTVLLVLAGAGRTPVGVSAWLSTTVPRYLGRISYAWYLWHWPCLVLLAGVGRTGEGESPPAARTVLVAVAVSLVLAVLTHHLVEEPLRRGRALADRRGTLALGATLTAAVACLPLLVPVSVQEGDRGLLEVVTGQAPVQQSFEAPSGSGQVLRLRQTPAEARRDRPFGSDDCYLLYESTDLQECRYETGSRTVVLLGDSHARQWLPAMRRAAREHDWTLYFFGKALCPLADVLIWAPDLRGPYPPCSQWRQQVLERIASLPDVDAVVVTRRGEYGDRVSGPDGQPLPEAQAQPLWEQGMRRSLETLTAAAGRVVLLEPVPRPPQDVPACVSEADGDWRRCAFPRASTSSRRVSVAEAEARAAEAFGDEVRRLDLTTSVCPDDPCQVVSARGTLVYWDDQHLTVSTSASLAGDLGDGVQRLLP